MASPKLPLLLASVVLAGCAWGGGDPVPNANANATGEAGAPGGAGDAPVESLGPRIRVAVENRLAGPLEARAALPEQGRGSGPFAVAPSATEERQLPYAGSGPIRVTLAYVLTGGGRSAGGEHETEADPETCAGTYRVLFVVEETDGTTFATAHGRCVRG